MSEREWDDLWFNIVFAIGYAGLLILAACGVLE